jgi:hypothetical protein
MKYFIALLLGILVGGALFAIGLYYNPFTGQPTVSPLAVTNDRVLDLSYSAVPAESILFTDHGESNVEPVPDRVSELWEPSVVNTRILVTSLQDSGGGMGVGIKFSSDAESSAPLRGEALVNSVWHVYVPDQGTFMIDQTENYWSYIRDIVIPAKWSSGDSWRGSFHRITTNGPGSLGTARVTGGSGYFAGVESESVESLTATGYSSVSGPVSMDGNLTVAVPQRIAAQE